MRVPSKISEEDYNKNSIRQAPQSYSLPLLHGLDPITDVFKKLPIK